MKWCVITALHKPYTLPSDPLYTPLQVGRALRPVISGPDGSPVAGDDTGDSISEKNTGYCELTGLWWMVHNVDAEFYGLCHYRRYFAVKRSGKPAERILTMAQAERLMTDTDVLLPKKRHYFIQSCYDQYTHAHHENDLLVTRQVLADQDDDRYVRAFDETLRRTSGHRFNMFIMRRKVFQAYAKWLFSVLFEVEKRLDTTGYSAQDLRVFGFLGERLMDVWLEVNRPVIRECPVVNLEPVNWPGKIAAFLKRAVQPARR